jgi:hypothetical protein
MQTLMLFIALAQIPLDPSALSWLAGCWRQESPSRVVEEMWMAPAGDGMLGAGRTVARGRIVDHEFLQIRAQNGRLVYIAKPAGQPEATFTASTVGEKEVVFENPAHDFPQRVIYRLRDDGSLLARIEGKEKGQARGVDFPMQRAACPSSSQP